MYTQAEPRPKYQPGLASCVYVYVGFMYETQLTRRGIMINYVPTGRAARRGLANLTVTQIAHLHAVPKTFKCMSLGLWARTD